MRKVAVFAGLVLVSLGAMAQPVVGKAADALTMDARANISSGNVFRGMDLAPNDFTAGGSLGLTHASGVGVRLSTQTAKLGSEGFFHNQAGVYYGFSAGPGVKVKVGVDRHFITGFEGASQANFTELVGSVDYQGLTGSMAYAVTGPDSFKKNLYTEVGYTYKFGSQGQYSVGGDVGMTFYSDKSRANGASNSISSAQVRAGAQLTKNVDLGVSYQMGLAEDGYGNKASANDKVMVRLGYKF